MVREDIKIPNVLIVVEWDIQEGIFGQWIFRDNASSEKGRNKRTQPSGVGGVAKANIGSMNVVQ